MGLFNRECKHLFGQVQEDGFQYCSNCGFAREPESTECKHNWLPWKEHPITNQGDRVGIIYVFKCEHCGETKQEKVGGSQ